MQTTFENSVAEGESAHNEQFLLLPPFKPYLIIVLSLIEILSNTNLFYVKNDKPLFPHADASEADDLWKQCDKIRNCS